MKSGVVTLIGYGLFIAGFLSILLSMVGLQLSPLKFLQSLGPGLSFLIQLIMIIAGLIIMYVSKTAEIDED